jgi:hypothetical protein
MTQNLPKPGGDSPAITERQQEIVDHILTTGQSVADAADVLGTDRCNIYRELRKPHVKKYLHERTLEHIGILAPIAAKVQGDLLSSDSDHVRATVADSILNRHLGKAVERKQVAFSGRIDVTIDLS